MKCFIKKFVWGRYLIGELHCVECWPLPRSASDEKSVKRYYKRLSGKEINLANPQTFCEKTNWYQLAFRNSLMTQ